MPRAPRLELPDGLFHVTVRGVDETSICRLDADYDRFVRLLTPIGNAHGWRCQIFCVMGTHYHLVVESKIRDLADGMEALNGRYAKLFNQDRGRRGHLFGARYYAKPISTTDHLFEAIRYVALNPVRAGLCRMPQQWRWGTYRSLLGIDPSPAFVDGDTILLQLGPTLNEARAALREYVEAALALDMPT
jgi:putative transposase